LRIPNTYGNEELFRSEITSESALVRELHVYGFSVAPGKSGNVSSVQHKGLGSRLLKRAEAIARENNRTKMVIISGIGVKEYYRKKHNYRKEGPYMVKKL